MHRFVRCGSISHSRIFKYDRCKIIIQFAVLRFISFMLFLFPSDYFNSKKIDEMYVEQAESLKNAGFNTAAICLESLASSSPKINPPLPQNSDSATTSGKTDNKILVIEFSGALALLLNVELERSPQIFTKTVDFSEELCHNKFYAGV